MFGKDLEGRRMTAPASINSLSSDYEIVARFQGDRFSYTTPWVVKHKPTGVLYASVFGDCNWWEAEAEETERVRYVLGTQPGALLEGRSPAEVTKDADYEFVRALDWHRDEPYVVRDKRTGQMWGCTYAMRADDSDYDQPAKWWSVTEEKVVEKKFKYKGES
jgi:hypothetical protein